MPGRRHGRPQVLVRSTTKNSPAGRPLAGTRGRGAHEHRTHQRPSCQTHPPRIRDRRPGSRPHGRRGHPPRAPHARAMRAARRRRRDADEGRGAPRQRQRRAFHQHAVDPRQGVAAEWGQPEGWAYAVFDKKVYNSNKSIESRFVRYATAIPSRCSRFCRWRASRPPS